MGRTASQNVIVTGDGQITIPKEIRNQLEIPVPGKVRFILDEEGNAMNDCWRKTVEGAVEH